MRQTIVFFLISLCSIQLVRSQELINLDISTFEEALTFERKLNSTIIDTVHITLADFDPKNEKPTIAVIFKRSIDDFPLTLHVWYHLDIDFNKLIRINYYHGFYNPSWNAKNDIEKLEQLTKSEDTFLSRYETYLEYLSKLYRTPKITDNSDSETNVYKQMEWSSDFHLVKLEYRFFRSLINNPILGYQVNNFELSFHRTLLKNM